VEDGEDDLYVVDDDDMANSLAYFSTALATLLSSSPGRPYRDGKEGGAARGVKRSARPSSAPLSMGASRQIPVVMETRDDGGDDGEADVADSPEGAGLAHPLSAPSTRRGEEAEREGRTSRASEDGCASALDPAVTTHDPGSARLSHTVESRASASASPYDSDDGRVSTSSTASEFGVSLNTSDPMELLSQSGSGVDLRLPMLGSATRIHEDVERDAVGNEDLERDAVGTATGGDVGGAPDADATFVYDDVSD